MKIKTFPWLITIRALLPALLVGSLASPASAAGTVDPDLKVCLLYTNGSIYNTNRPVFLYRWEGLYDGGWVHTRTQNADRTGCTTFADVRPDYWFKAVGYYYYAYGGSWWIHQGSTDDIYPERFVPDAQYYGLAIVNADPKRWQ